MQSLTNYKVSNPNYGENSFDDGIVSMGLLTICSLGAGLAAWIWYRDPKSGKVTRRPSLTNKNTKGSSKFGVEYLCKPTPDCITKTPQEECEAPSLDRDSQSESTSQSTNFADEEGQDLSITPESPTENWDMEVQDGITVTASSSGSVGKLTMSMLTDTAFSPVQSPKTRVLCLSKPLKQGCNGNGGIPCNGSTPEGFSIGFNDFDKYLQDYGEYKTQVGDPFEAIECTGEIFSLDTDLKLVSRKLKKLRRKSIDLLLRPKERRKSCKTWEEVEQEISKYEKTKSLLQNQRDELLNKRIRNLMNNEMFGVAPDEETKLIKNRVEEGCCKTSNSTKECFDLDENESDNLTCEETCGSVSSLSFLEDEHAVLRQRQKTL